MSLADLLGKDFVYCMDVITVHEQPNITAMC